MRRKYIFLTLLILAGFALLFTTCKKDEGDPPVVEKNGNFRVFVRNAGNYFTGATVELFLSTNDRDIGNVYMTGVTTAHGALQTDKYVQFDTLVYRKYYLKATYDDGAGNIYIGQEPLGTGVWATKDTTTYIYIDAIP